MSNVSVSDVIAEIDRLAPPDLAESWDPIGLSFGSTKQSVKRVLIALDVDKDTIEEAKQKQADLIVTHHPAIFTSQKTLNQEDERRKQYIDLIKSDIAVYSAHTNLDAAAGGMNDWLADSLGIRETGRRVMSVSVQRGFKKLAVYVPDYASDNVRKALHAVGAGKIGAYTDVSYTLSGYGRFTPQEGADPTEGEIGKEERIHEERIEMMIKDADVMKSIAALKAAHPYEEPVYDIFTLEYQSEPFGFGRVGDLNEPLSASDLAEKVNEQFDVDGVRYGSVDADRKHTQIAVLGGSGEKYYKEALNKGATLYVTGDISYHGAQDMLRDGLDFIDAGHYMEAIAVPKLYEYLNQCKKENQWDIEILKAETQKDVFTYIK
ncbi:Nif3-like dinuclear metal center hexameric protein [Alkalibacterium putridalgicola]|uniref:Nif3-like dinuclear metal center hexameric protein n=1 Tax=Alkalibacterium putridalgicola TaxID=426703 RepID=UPI0034CF5CB0